MAVGVIAAVLTAFFAVAAQAPRHPNASGEAGRAALATSLAQVVLEPGIGWYAGPACDAAGHVDDAAFQPEGIGALENDRAAGRFGLGQEACAQTSGSRAVANLSFEKLSNLYAAQHAADATNGHVDYEEARRSLGLSPHVIQFHLRSWPLLPDLAQVLEAGYRDPNLRALYIGDYTSSTGGDAPAYAAGAVPGEDRVVVFVNVTNDGATTTYFDALFELDLKDDRVSFTLHTEVLAPGQSGNMTLALLKTADWTWKHASRPWVDVEIRDKNTKLAETAVSLAGVSMTHAQTRVNVFAEAEKLGTAAPGGSAEAKYYYEARDGRGRLADVSDWTYALYDPSGNLVRADPLPTREEGHLMHTFTATGSYTAKLLDDAMTTVWNEDTVNIVDPEPGPYLGASSFAPAASVAPEIGFLQSLLVSFDAHAFATTYHHPTVAFAEGGDVYPDVKDAMNDDLPLALVGPDGLPTLERYTTLVVGSNVDQNAMTSQAAKGTIRDWVYAGGSLVVFGSADQSVNWLQPIFHSSLDSASGGVGTPDENHPILHTPNDLDYEAYNYATEWNYNADSGESFAHVVTSGTSGDLLSVSDPGVFGNGSVFLTSYRPFDLVDGQAADCTPGAFTVGCEALRLVLNLLTTAYRDLFIDYGPMPPNNAPVAVTFRLVNAHHPEFGEAIPMMFQTFVFDRRTAGKASRRERRRGPTWMRNGGRR